MKTVRNNVFETNSSSMHAIVIDRRDFSYDECKVKKISVNFKKQDFTARYYVKRNSVNEKATYLFGAFLCEVLEALNKPNKYTALNDEQKEKALKVEKAYNDFLDFTKEGYAAKGIDFIHPKIKFVFSDEGVWTKDYPMLGCFEHTSLLKETGIYDYMEDIVKGEWKDSWKGASYIFPPMGLEFIVNDSVVLQGSDEMGDLEEGDQAYEILETTKKCKGLVSVVWPEGG